MTEDEELLASSLWKLGGVESDDAGLDERVIRFQGALRRLRTDPAEAARIDALAADAEASDGSDDEIVEGEIIDDSEDGELTPPGSEDTSLAPCDPGSTCGLHVQVTYGSRVPKHEPSMLDNGEMALLAEAARRRYPSPERLQ